MAEEPLDKAVCISCGADVREGTTFCYACGKPVAKVTEVEDKVDEPAVESIKTTEEKSAEPGADKSEKLANAAAERKKSRVGQRKPKKVVWEEPGAASNRIFLLVSVLIAVVAGGLVFLMVFVK